MFNTRYTNPEYWVSEDEFSIFEMNAHGEYARYSANSLITCFAYLILYQSNQNTRKAVLYHASCGHPERMPEIFNQIKSDYNFLHEIIIAIPAPINSVGVFDLLCKCKLLLQQTFNLNNDKNITIVENAIRYTADTLGNHGVLSVPKNTSSENEDVFIYLKQLKDAIDTTEFTVINWLSDEVVGTPKGIIALKNHLIPLNENNKSNIFIILNNISNELDIINKRESSRTKITDEFYEKHTSIVAIMKDKACSYSSFKKR